MTAAQIRKLANELTNIGKNYRDFTCINEMMTRALVESLGVDLLERREQAALLDNAATEVEDGPTRIGLLNLATELRNQ